MKNQIRKIITGNFANVVLPLDVIQDAIVVPTQAVPAVQNGKKSLYFYLAKPAVMVENSNKNRCLSLIPLSGSLKQVIRL
jgi:membrane fusion protein (multidrug efflux system)